jgi:hypothetical protein
MSEPNELVEMSAEELDSVAGGAFLATKASNFNFSDSQLNLVNIGADGGIMAINQQETKVSKQELLQVQATGEAPSDIFGIFGAE